MHTCRHSLSLSPSLHPSSSLPLSRWLRWVIGLAFKGCNYRPRLPSSAGECRVFVMSRVIMPASVAWQPLYSVSGASWAPEPWPISLAVAAGAAAMGIK